MAVYEVLVRRTCQHCILSSGHRAFVFWGDSIQSGFKINFHRDSKIGPQRKKLSWSMQLLYRGFGCIFSPIRILAAMLGHHHGSIRVWCHMQNLYSDILTQQMIAKTLNSDTGLAERYVKSVYCSMKDLFVWISLSPMFSKGFHGIVIGWVGVRMMFSHGTASWQTSNTAISIAPSELQIQAKSLFKDRPVDC